MSLINDALKKAQKMRHEESLAAAKSPAGESQQNGGRSRLSAGLIALISGGTALAVCAAVLAGLVLLRSNRNAARASAPATQVSETAVQPVAANPAKPLPSQPAPAQASPVASPTPKPAPASNTGGVAAESAPLISLPSSVATKTAATEPLAAATQVQPQPPPAAAQEKPAAPQQAPVFVFSQPEPDHSKPNPASQRFVDRVRVTGVRKTSSGAKVMINEKVYRINDVVDQTLGLRLVEAESDRLVFTDEYGHRYVRNFLP